MSHHDEWPPVGKILAIGASVTGGLLALGYALKMVIPAIGVAVGLAFSTATTGLATAGAVSTWVAPAAGAGLGLSGIVLSVHLLIKVSENAKARPYAWTLPLLGAAAAVGLSLWKDLSVQPPAVELLVGGLAAVWIVVAGVCYKRAGRLWKCSAILLYLLPPLVLLGLETSQSGAAPAANYFAKVPARAWIAVTCFALIALIIGIMEKLTRDEIEE
jgi:hypothetical protein